MENYQKYLENIKKLIVDPEFLEWYKQQPIDFTSRCEYVRAALVWNTAKGLSAGNASYVDAGVSCWYCKEYEQHTNQRQGYCHKHKFDSKAKIAKLIKCNDFIHY